MKNILLFKEISVLMFISWKHNEKCHIPCHTVIVKGCESTDEVNCKSDQFEVVINGEKVHNSVLSEKLKSGRWLLGESGVGGSWEYF
jgi:hypothetical protein